MNNWSFTDCPDVSGTWMQNCHLTENCTKLTCCVPVPFEEAFTERNMLVSLQAECGGFVNYEVENKMWNNSFINGGKLENDMITGY